MRIEFKQGDITHETGDAIVNAANERGLGGDGVDGAIHKAAGPALLAACQALPEKAPGVRIPEGEAVATEAGNLPVKWVIHTVGPRWKGGEQKEEETLAKAYDNSLKVADEKGCKSVSFPSISTGVYGYPIEKAAEVAIRTINAYGKTHPQTNLKEVRMVLFSENDYNVYTKAYSF